MLELNFPLLSDWNGEAVAGFGIEIEDFHGMHGVAERSAFLIDEGGTVSGAWHYATDEVPNFDELLQAGRALRH